MPQPTPPTRLPESADTGPVRVTIPGTRFPISVTWVAQNMWSIDEAIGYGHVAHGYLLYSGGQFAIKTAAGTQTYDHSWQTAIGAHLRTK